MSTLPENPPVGWDIAWPEVPATAPESAQAELSRRGWDKDWGKAALTPGTPEHQQKQALQARVLQEQEHGAPTAPPDPQAYYLGTQELDFPARDWLSLAGFDKAGGEGFAKLVEQRARDWPSIDPAKSEADLRAVLKDGYDDGIAKAKRLVDAVEAKRPGLKQWLAETGAGNDPLVIRELMNLATRRYGY